MFNSPYYSCTFEFSSSVVYFFLLEAFAGVCNWMFIIIISDLAKGSSKSLVGGISGQNKFSRVVRVNKDRGSSEFMLQFSEGMLAFWGPNVGSILM